MANVYEQIAYAIGLAVLYGLLSYLKNRNTENFDLRLFLKTIIIGVCVGVVQFQYGMTYDQALQWTSTNALLTFWIDRLVNNLLEWLKIKPKERLPPSTNIGGVPLR